MNKYNEDNYKDKCKELNLIYIGNHKEYHKGTVIEFVCNKHKEKGVQNCDWSHFRTYKIGCKYCSGRGKTNSDIIQEIKNKDVELISEYKGNEKPINCKCKKCGNTWITLPKVLTTNGSGCPICGRRQIIKAKTKTKEKFINEIKQVNPNIIILGDYVNTHTKIKCKCLIDNTVWYGYPANLLNKSAGCPVCNISVGEKTLLNCLNNLNIPFIPQYTEDGCKLYKNLRFDAFNNIHRIAFEYNGEQHYRPVDFAGKGIEWAKSQFEITSKRDLTKKNYCINNDITLITIPHWERDNMEEYIKKELERNNYNYILNNNRHELRSC